VGKSLDQLAITDAPITVTDRAPRSTDPRETEWYQTSQEIDQLLATGRYTWAEETLHSIQASIERLERVTPGQKRALLNIENAVADRERGRGRRRYEGFSSRFP
jgi:hypothetical protein